MRTKMRRPKEIEEVPYTENISHDFTSHRAHMWGGTTSDWGGSQPTWQRFRFRVAGGWFGGSYERFGECIGVLTHSPFHELKNEIIQDKT